MELAKIGSIDLKNPELERCTDEELAVIAENDSEAMYVLIARFTKLIKWKASQFCGAVEADDLAQEGFLGLLSAVAGFDKERNVKFSTYAGTCITNRMLSAIRSSSSVPTPVGDMSASVFEVEDNEALPDSIVMQREEWSVFWQDMISQLSNLEYQICIMFMGGSDYAEIAEHLGISVKSVDNALQRIRRKLRRKSM